MDTEGFVDVPELTETVQRDFLRNEQDFALNKYTRCDVIDEPWDGQNRRWYGGRIGGRVLEQATWDESDRRTRMLAQQAMTFRTMLAIEALAMKATEIETKSAAVDLALAGIPSNGRVFVVTNDMLEEDFEHKFGIWKQRHPGVEHIIDNTIKVTVGEDRQMHAGSIVPDNRAFIVFRQNDPIDGVPLGLSLRCAKEWTFRVQKKEVDDVPCAAGYETGIRIGLADHFVPHVNGHCFQFMLRKFARLGVSPSPRHARKT